MGGAFKRFPGRGVGESKSFYLFKAHPYVMVENEKSLSDLASFLNQRVRVTSKDGREFKGVLINYDEHMNLVLSDVETSDGKKHQLVIIKGGNISDISSV